MAGSWLAKASGSSELGEAERSVLYVASIRKGGEVRGCMGGV